MNRPPLKAKSRRRGFTLIELLVVVVIIVTLIALLVPVIASAVRAARNASVQAEINQMAQALADFKTKYGDYPPSRVILAENGRIPSVAVSNISGGLDPTGKIPTDISGLQLANRTVNAMRKFWPRAPFTIGGVLDGTSTLDPGFGKLWFDFNGNGVAEITASATPLYLQGHECLVFFLGGIPLTINNGQISVIGFDKNPINPFTNGLINSGAMYSANRNPPFFPFDGGRLNYTNGSSSQIPGYLDSLRSQPAKQNFYAYFSTNNGSGYDPNDMNVKNDADFDNTGTQVALQFCAPLAIPAQTGQSQRTLSFSPNPYTMGSTVPNMSLNQTPAYINAQSYQIISPGTDGGYGTGGIYAAIPAGGSPELASTPQNSLTNSNDAGIRTIERDNLTNFHNGKLE